MSPLYKKIVVPLDGSELAAQALPHAEEIARGAGAQLILLRVVENPVRMMAAIPGLAGSGGSVGAGSIGVVAVGLDSDAHRQALDDAKTALESLAASLRHRKINAVADIDTGDPASRIVDYAVANAVDLIVMSTHGRTGMARWTHGSVATKVLHAAPCAVFTVRPASLEPIPTGQS